MTTCRHCRDRTWLAFSLRSATERTVLTYWIRFKQSEGQIQQRKPRVEAYPARPDCQRAHRTSDMSRALRSMRPLAARLQGKLASEPVAAFGRQQRRCMSGGIGTRGCLRLNDTIADAEPAVSLRMFVYMQRVSCQRSHHDVVHVSALVPFLPEHK